MRYQGSEAQRLETAERRRSQHNVERMPLRPSFEVVEGAGLDARVREGVSPEFLLRVRVVLIAVAIFIVLGLARVALYSATVSSLTANEDLRTQIASAQATKSDLQISASTLSSSTRIDRIATQNYGMVAPTETEKITLEDQAASSSTSTADGATSSTQQ